MRKFLCLVFVLFAASVYAQTKPAHPEMLVSTDWLAQHLNDPDLVILEFPKDKATFAAGHIPGARAIYGEQIFEKHGDVESELLPVEKLVKNFEDLGVSNNSHVVIYTTGWPPMAPRVYFTLDYLGLGDRASVLDGGLDKWKKEGRKVSTDVPSIKPGKIAPKPRPELVASFNDVKAASGDGSRIIVDTRPDRRYTGGHIPGAAHVYWKQNVDSNNEYQFLPPDEMQKNLASVGAAPGKKLITYCEIGWQASHGYFTAKYLGYEVKMYDGSYNEWDDVKHEPVVKGDKPR